MINTHNQMENLKQDLAEFFRNDYFTISQVPGGASAKTFFKLEFNSSHYFPEATVLLMVVPQEESRILSDFTNIAYYLKRKAVATPRLYEIQQPRGWLFSEFIESPTLEAHFNAHPDSISTVLPDLVEFLIDMQKRCPLEQHCPAFQRKFDHDKYMFEFNFHFRQQLLDYYFKSRYDIDTVNRFAEHIAGFLDISLPMFVHRDFQSSNIFYHGEARFSVIDFQDARSGSPVYDLVSILWDSYYPHDDAQRGVLLDRYFQALSDSGISWKRDYYNQVISYTVIQRKLHDAGAFAYNYRRFGSKKYLRYIREAVDMALVHITRFPHFDDVRGVLETAMATHESH